MSIRTNPMKAVPLMLKRVNSMRNNFLKRGRNEFDTELKTLTRKLNSIKDLFEKVKKNENELLDTLTDLDGHLRKLDEKVKKNENELLDTLTDLNEDVKSICQSISECADKLLPKDALPKDTSDIKLDSSPSSSQHTNELRHDTNGERIKKNDEGLGYLARKCLDSLSVFPKDAVIKTKAAIYWWIGLGHFDEKDVHIEMEEGVGKGKGVINDLLGKHMIIPYGNGKDPDVTKFKINPLIHGQLPMDYKSYRSLCLLEQQRVTLGGKDRLKPETRFIFNLCASYVNFESQWLANNKNLEILQLGRWQDSPLHHIEVGSEEFLKELKGQKELRHLSLRGISRIFELPPSIAQLEGLQILDLKACHNLETLPNIASMKSLTHLILSKCYLLDSMPKGIGKLTRLKVLMGFVVSSSGRISDLANLKDLRRLSIHIASEADIKNRGFESLEELSNLERLKISWGVSDESYSNIKIKLPSSLKKLHIEGYRGENIPEWMKPSKMPQGCQELYITGGNLKSMAHDENMQWRVEIVRLKYLKHLQIDLKNFQVLFPLLRYAELKKISNQPYIKWSVHRLS